MSLSVPLLTENSIFRSRNTTLELPQQWAFRVYFK